jgi:hypothetical protein
MKRVSGEELTEPVLLLAQRATRLVERHAAEA